MFTPKSTGYEERERAMAMNAAPDSIVGMFKPGEFVLPPDTVHAMGGKQALQGVVDATHTPVNGGFGLRRRPPEPTAKPASGLGSHRAMLESADPVEAPQLGLRPKVFFANGGAPEDQIQQSGVAAKASAAPSPSNTFPGSRLPGNSGFSSAPPSAPTATPKPAPVGMTDTQRTDALAQIPTGGIKAPAPDGSQDAWSNTEAGRNFGNAAAALPGLGGMGRVASTGGAISRSMNAASTASNNAGRAVLGASLLGGTSPAAATSTTSAAPTTPAAGAGRGSINPPLVNPGAPSPAVASTPAVPSNQLVDGVYNHGRGQYSDQAGGMGFPAGFTGKPNAQNDAAAGALAQSGSFGLQRPAVAPASEAPALGLYVGRGAEADSQPGWSGSIGQSSGNGNMWSRTPEQQRRDAETQASSIHRQTAANGAAALRGLDVREMEAMRGTNALQQEQMRQVGGLQRTAMTEAGTTGRAALAESGASSRASGQLGLGLRRLTLDQQRANSDERLRAPQIKAAERLGQLQESYINAKTPEEQAAIASQMRAYAGKDEADWKVQVTPATKNVDGSTTAGSVIRYNSRNGDVQDVSGVGGGSQSLPPGMTKQVGTAGGKPVYEDSKGNRFVG
ncbi:hypothetical protein [Comamonas sp. 26]|uniref:hypothetical protein n=1 Tax=Comamonas sp. 26 TaxID=2035201 RepID=UPI000C188AA8|nr:hypothetical protein [Comamonas sp. 26]PIG09615.1 hypothetical protein CLU84_2545 [Comamonas sp. 26]